MPKLSDTLSRYLESTEPHLSAEQFQRTKEIVQAFEKSENAVKMQKYLEEKAKNEDNWVNIHT